MAQSGFTPIQLYYSTTAAAAPSAGNLANGELAINITDGRLFYKDNGGVVRVLATAAGAAGDVVGPGSSTDNALVRFDGTTGKLVQSSAGVLDDSGNLTGLASLTATTLTGALTGTVGATTPNTGAFTTLAASGAVTLSGGTANGVTYLNGSKVLTSGSALTFDGTGFGVVTSAPTVTIFETASGNNNRLVISQAAGIATYNQTYSSGSTNAQVWQIGSSEQMRLTSTGLGIGTSSPVYKLVVSNNGASGIEFGPAFSGTANLIQSYNRSGGAYVNTVYDANEHIFNTIGTQRMRLDSAGNLGLGVTPSAWLGSYKALQLTGGAIQGGTSGLIEVYANSYRDSNGDFIYTSSAGAGRYAVSDAHRWFTAPSGTAGNAISFTQAMTLDASGRLLVGTTTAQGQLTISNLSGSIGLTAYTSGGSVAEHTYSNTPGVQIDSYQSVFGSPYTKTTDIVANADSGAASQLRLFTTSAGSAPAERARIDSSGNLLVGTTSDGAGIGAPSRLAVRVTSGYAAILRGQQSGNAIVTAWNSSTAGDGVFHEFGTETSYTVRGTISFNRTAGLTAYNTTSDYRAKDIIGPVADSGALIDSVPVYMGKMKGATQERPMFIAHETPSYAHTGEKDAVDKDGKPVFQQMDASALVPVMWAELQSLRARVAELEAA